MSEKRVTHRHDRGAGGRRFVYVVRVAAVGRALGRHQPRPAEDLQLRLRLLRGDRPGRDRPAARSALRSTRTRWRPSSRAVLAELAATATRPRATSRSPGTASRRPSAGFLPLARSVFDVRDAAGLPALPVDPDHERLAGSRGPRCRRRTTSSPRAAGSFWIKLDAGTEPFYRAVCRTSVPFARILANLAAASRRHPVVVQSMFFRSDELGVPSAARGRRVGRPARGRRPRGGRARRRTGLHGRAGDGGGRESTPSPPTPSRRSRPRRGPPLPGVPRRDLPLTPRPLLGRSPRSALGERPVERDRPGPVPGGVVQRLLGAREEARRVEGVLGVGREADRERRT